MSTEAQASPAGGGLLDQIMEQTSIAPSDEGYALARKGVEALVSELVAGKSAEQKIDKATVEAMIAEIDKKLSKQLDAR